MTFYLFRIIATSCNRTSDVDHVVLFPFSDRLFFISLANSDWAPYCSCQYYYTVTIWKFRTQEMCAVFCVCRRIYTMSLTLLVSCVLVISHLVFIARFHSESIAFIRDIDCWGASSNCQWNEKIEIAH